MKKLKVHGCLGECCNDPNRRTYETRAHRDRNSCTVRSVLAHASDVRIAGIEGNKDIHMTAGDLRIDVLPESYSHVHASVTFGDLRAHALGISKDGIGSSFEWSGAGKYILHASLFAGDLTLSQGRLPLANGTIDYVLGPLR